MDIEESINRLPEILRHEVRDIAKRFGHREAICLLQKVLNKMAARAVPVDGNVCDVTVAAANIAVNVYGNDVIRNLKNALAEYDSSRSN